MKKYIARVSTERYRKGKLDRERKKEIRTEKGARNRERKENGETRKAAQLRDTSSVKFSEFSE